jgi:hypothetical protein
MATGGGQEGVVDPGEQRAAWSTSLEDPGPTGPPRHRRRDRVCASETRLFNGIIILASRAAGRG